MKIILNNRPETIPGIERMTVRELLEHKRFTFKFLVVRINGKPIKPADYDSQTVRGGDDVKVIHLISGG